MGTRRLRLYVVAYLRGLLPPYYAQGTLSIVREEMILSALSSELDNETLKQLNVVQASMASLVKDRSGYFDKLYSKLNDFRYRLEHMPVSVLHKPTKGARTKDPVLNKLLDNAERAMESGEWDRVDAALSRRAKTLEKNLKLKSTNPYLTADRNDSGLTWQYGGTEEEKDSLNED